LDAAFAHFYGLTKDELAYILETFTVLRSREEKEYGTFRTRDTVLALFDIVETMLNRDPDASECSNTSAAKDGMK
jgi:hypothetical protein